MQIFKLNINTRSWMKKSLFLLPCLFFLECSKKESTPLVNDPKTATTRTVTGTDFTIVVMPDTQNYMSGYFGGLYAMFTDQINWIINNAAGEKIAYVVGLGDEVE